MSIAWIDSRTALPDEGVAVLIWLNEVKRFQAAKFSPKKNVWHLMGARAPVSRRNVSHWAYIEGPQ